MPPERPQPSIHRIVECTRARWRSRWSSSPLRLRIDHPVGGVDGDGSGSSPGPDALRLHGGVPLRGRGRATVADWTMTEGTRRAFSLAWYDSSEPEPYPLDNAACQNARRWWTNWVRTCAYAGGWQRRCRSVVHPRGADLRRHRAVSPRPPPRSPRNRRGLELGLPLLVAPDATMTLQAFLISGYAQEAAEVGSLAAPCHRGESGDFQVMLGVRGQRRLTALELDWLPATRDHDRCGSATRHPPSCRWTSSASDGRRADRLARRLPTHRRAGVGPDRDRPDVAAGEGLDEPDDGIWKVRDRAGTSPIPRSWPGSRSTSGPTGRAGPAEGSVDEARVEQWRDLRNAVHAEVCAELEQARWAPSPSTTGRPRGASLLLMCFGRLPPLRRRTSGPNHRHHPARALRDEFVKRYQTGADNADGLPVHRVRSCSPPSGLRTRTRSPARPTRRRDLHRLLALRSGVTSSPRVRPGGPADARQLSAGCSSTSGSSTPPPACRSRTPHPPRSVLQDSISPGSR